MNEQEQADPRAKQAPHSQEGKSNTAFFSSPVIHSFAHSFIPQSFLEPLVRARTLLSTGGRYRGEQNGQNLCPRAAYDPVEPTGDK